MPRNSASDLPQNSVYMLIAIVGSGTCSDVLPNCDAYTQASCVDPYVDWAIKNCPHYCGLCGRTSQVATVTSAPGGGFSGQTGGCIYKQKYYAAGDKWQDGCEFNCTCENGQTGFYKCVDMCPSYQLPAGCTLKKNPGECCSVPDCAGVTGTGTGSGTVTGDTPGCVYGGVLYQHGQTWKDGCKYRCTCVDGRLHQFSCSGLCLNWQLPNVCHLDPPAAGKCCQTPNCPTSVTLNYPAGYIAE